MTKEDGGVCVDLGVREGKIIWGELPGGQEIRGQGDDPP